MSGLFAVTLKITGLLHSERLSPVHDFDLSDNLKDSGTPVSQTVLLRTNFYKNPLHFLVFKNVPRTLFLFRNGETNKQIRRQLPLKDSSLLTVRKRRGHVIPRRAVRHTRVSQKAEQARRQCGQKP